MNKRIVIHLASVVAAIVGFAMLCTGGVSRIMGDPLEDTLQILLCALFTLAVSLSLAFFTRPRTERERKVTMREGFAVVAFSWFSACLFGCLPFIVVVEMNWYDAIFETVSGFTTTGATLIDNTLRLASGKTLPEGIESLPFGILFWRSLCHWLGGMGIVVLSIAVLPLLNIGGQVLYSAEVTGVKSSGDQLTPRIAGTAKLLWLVYVFLTALETIFLWAGGLSLFDALCESFSTISTGGFSTKTNSIGAYDSNYVNWVVIVFMFLAGCNFVLHFRAITGKPKSYWKDEEFRFYTLIILFSTLVITGLLFFSDVLDPMSGKEYRHDLLGSFEAALFQVVAILTSTGFSTGDYTAWPTAAGAILFGLMFVCACGGSTTGGLKCVRVLLLGKYALSAVKRCIYPRMIPDVRLNSTRLEETTLQKAVGFFALFIATFFVFVLLLTLVCEMSLDTALSASITCLSNVGPGFAQIGPSCSFAWMTPAAKLILSFEMLLGRLELFTILLLFLPSFWKR